MEHLHINDVIKPVGEHALLDGLSRALHINREEDLAVLIPIDYERETEKPRTGKSAKRCEKADRRVVREAAAGECESDEQTQRIKCYYWRGWKKRSLCALEAGLGDGRIVKTELELPRLVTMTDEEIQKRYPPRRRIARKRPTKRKDGRTQLPRRMPRMLPDGKTAMSATLDLRERRREAIEPIVERIRKAGTVIFETDEIAELVSKQCTDDKAKAAFLLDALHRQLALGCGFNALLGNLESCGGEGPRKQTKRIGRPLGLYTQGDIDDPGKFLTDVDKSKIGTAWRTFVEIEKLSRRKAYMLFLGAYYSSGTKLFHGITTPKLLPVQHRPSFAQFCYWGPRGDGNKSAFEAHLKPQEWEQKYRALSGTVTRNIPGIGHTAFMDSTRTNTVLVSMMSRLNALGTGHRIMAHDAFSDVVPAPYCGLKAPSEETALLAVYCGASSVVPLAKRFNLELTEEQIPRLLWAKYVCDNTDLRTRGSMQVLKQVNSSIEYVEVNRPERKGPVEAGHHSFNADLDESMDGSNHGRRTERGEEPAAISACWTYFEYYAELLLAIAYHNTQADASALFDSHPCRTEMARAGVPRTRMGIFQWAKRTPGRDCTPVHDIRVLRARLLPVFQARVFANGVRVMRPERGDKREYIAGMRFMGPSIERAQLRERARRGEEVLLDLRMDPQDPQHAWYADDKGMHELMNMCADPIMQREAILGDYLAHQDGNHRQDLIDQTDREQAESNVVHHRFTKNRSNRDAKKAEIAAAKEAGKKVTKKSLKTGIAAHREEEAERVEKLLDLVHPCRANPAQAANTPVEPKADRSDNASATPAPTEKTLSAAEQALQRYRELRKVA